MNRVAIVTGATSGIGKTVAEALISEGDRVLAIGRDERRLEAIGGRYPKECETYRVDVSVRGEVERFFDAVRSKHTCIDKICRRAAPGTLTTRRTRAYSCVPVQLLT
jgi:NADP-dependent 3-hydroxy acid dehydrogenase YdfG